eukprot:RCo031179
MSLGSPFLGHPPQCACRSFSFFVLIHFLDLLWFLSLSWFQPFQTSSCSLECFLSPSAFTHLACLLSGITAFSGQRRFFFFAFFSPWQVFREGVACVVSCFVASKNLLHLVPCVLLGMRMWAYTDTHPRSSVESE